MRVYQYRCNDYSLLTPGFKRWLVAPLLRFVPWAMPANFVTLFSNLFVYFGLYLALHPNVFGTAGTRLIIAGCLLIYLIGDHLDGMQAKRTGTGSALGEFFDHYLDAFNNGIIVFTMLTVFGITHPVMVAIVITASYLAHMAVFYEQFKTGWLTFEKLGSLEGVLISSLIMALSSLTPVNSFLNLSLIGEFTVIECILLGSAAGAVMTFLTTWKRTPDVKPGFWLFTILTMALATTGIFLFSAIQLFIVLTLYCSLYVGRIMQGHLVDGVERHPDWPAILYMFLFLALSLSINTYSFLILAGYLMICIGILVYHVFSALKIYWVWVNVRS
jgi:phosphatidylglycerophosphate synthase